MSILSTIGMNVFKLAFECSPIILTQGIAKKIPGGLLPIVTITESANLVSSLLSGTEIGLDKFFAHFAPLPGSSLISNQFAHYPFANVQVAANAIIKQPLRFSMSMTCPIQHAGGLSSRLITFTALKLILDRHHSLGGTYTVATPTYIYTNCLLADLKSVGDTGAQKQTVWQWDFEQPLITVAQAQQAQNDQMSKLGPNGTPSPGANTGVAGTVGSTGSGAGTSVIGTASGPAASTGSFQSAATIPVTSTPLAAPK